MNIDGILRIIAGYGDTITLRRLTGVQRVPYDVVCAAAVITGADSVVVNGVQQTADRIILTSREIDQSQWRGEPRHGDQIVYADGRVTTVQGRADVRPMPNGDRVFILHTLGG